MEAKKTLFESPQRRAPASGDTCTGRVSVLITVRGTIEQEPHRCTARATVVMRNPLAIQCAIGDFH